MTKREAINLIDIIRMGYICDPQECGAENARELCDIFKCGDFHEACVVAMEALEEMEHKCENCNHRRSIDFDVYWCLVNHTEVYGNMSCTDWNDK